jgi:hypothetical protein
MFPNLKAGKAPPTCVIDVDDFLADLPARPSQLKTEFNAAKLERVQEHDVKPPSTREKREVFDLPSSTQ